VLNDKRIKSCLSRFDSGAYCRLHFLRAVSHSVGTHTESLQPRDDNSSSSSSSEDEDEDRQAPVPAAKTSGASESATAAAATTSDDCSEVCFVAPRVAFALVPFGHARFCEACAMRVSLKDGGCPVCRADITMVMRLFIVSRNVDQRAGQLIGITKTEINRTKNFNSMSSSYNTPCSKHKLVVSIYSNTETSLAMSILAQACSMVPRCQVSRFQRPQLFSCSEEVFYFSNN